MPSNTFQMIHEVRGVTRGTAADHEITAKLIRDTNDHLAEGYAAASARRGKSKTKADFLAAFAAGDLYLTADQAIEWGLADEKTEPAKLAACLADISALDGAPEALRTAPYVAARLADPVINVSLPDTAAAIAAAVQTEFSRLAATQESPATPALPPVAETTGSIPEGPKPMSEEQKPHVAASEPAVVAVSGVKLLGVATEAEAEAKIKELINTNLQITGATGKATIGEAMAVILDWKTRADMAAVLTNKVATLTEESRVAKRDEAIERMSREGTLPPARHDWARTQFATAEQVETFCAGMPKGFFANIEEPTKSDSLTLDANERKVCASLGISETDYLEQKKLELRKAG